jgi:hypothetical protein
MMQLVGAFAELEPVMLREKGGSGFCPPGRTHRRTSPKADASTTVQDPEVGFIKAAKQQSTLPYYSKSTLVRSRDCLRQIAFKVLR